MSRIRSIEWSDGRLYLLDQTRLPVEVEVEEQTSVEQLWQSIRKLKVRGAPAIGVAGGYGLVLGMKENRHLGREKFLEELRTHADFLNGSRPTAVNLSWALKRIVTAAEDSSAQTGEELFQLVQSTAEEIHKEDIELCLAIGRHGKPLIQRGMGILTHCNAGRLATSDFGTATAPLYLAHDAGIPFTVYSDETRPLLQGSRLTAWELQQAGIDVRIITDNMAAFVMQQGMIDMVVVGTDRVAANGDVANKIGTLGVAILARHFGIPFYVAAPSSTIDRNTPTGNEIVIEERETEEVTHFGLRRTAPEGISVLNPAFDVTPADYVTALITDKGIIGQPLAERIGELFV